MRSNQNSVGLDVLYKIYFNGSNFSLVFTETSFSIMPCNFVKDSVFWKPMGQGLTSRESD